MKRIFVLLLFSFHILYSFNIEKISEFSLTDVYTNSIRDMTLKDNNLLSINSRAVQIFDVNNNEIELITEFNLQGSLVTISVSDNYAYVATKASTSRLYCIDITNTTNPTVVDTISYLGSYVNFVNDGKLFVNELHDNYTWSVHVYDESNFNEINEFQVNPITYPMKIVDDSIASVKSQDQIYLYDISDPFNVMLIDSHFAEPLADYKVTIIQDSILFINDISGLKIYDMSTPGNWNLIYNFNNSSILDYEIMDDKLIILSFGNLELYDISSINNPMQLDILYLNPYENNCWSVLGSVSLFYSKTEQGQILLLDIFNDTIDLLDSYSNLGELNSCYYYYDHLYIASMLGGIQQFDISDINNPIYENSYYENNYAFNINGCENLFVNSMLNPILPNYLNVVLEIDNAGSLNEITTFENINQNEINLYYCEDIGYFYVYNSVLYKYILDDSNELIEVASLQLPDIFDMGLIFFYQDFAYIQCLDDLVIVDNIETNNMFLVNEINTGMFYEELDFFQNHLFLSTTFPNEECAIYNISDPTEPSLVLNIDNSGVLAIDELNELLFMSCYECEVYDLSQINLGFVNQIDSFRNWSNCNDMIPFHKDGNNFLIYLEDTSCSIYQYTTDPNYLSEELIEIFANLSNHPNPFNPSTEIRFQISDFSQTGTAISHESARIDIYNLKGQKVKTFCHAELVEASGTPNNYYSVTWNGDDNNGKPVSSGIYFYQLNNNGKALAQKKCLLLK